MRSFAIALIVLSFLLFGCTEQAAVKQDPIRIGVSLWPGYGYVLLAEEKGFFAANGVDAHFVIDNSSSPAPSYEKYLNSEVDIVLLPINYAIDANVVGVRSTVVMYLDSSDSSDVFMVPAEVQTYADLKDKTLGVEGFNSYSHIFVVQLLRKNGLNPGDYELKKVAGEAVLTELEAGTIGGGYTWGATKAAALDKGYVILGRGSDVPRLISDVMILRSQFAASNREDIEAIMRSILEARNYAVAHPDEANAIIADKMQVPAEEVKIIVSEVALPGLNENVEAMTKSDDATSLYRVAETIADFYIGTGQISQKPVIDQMMDPSFITAVASD